MQGRDGKLNTYELVLVALRKNKWNIILDEAVKPEDIMY